jgi:hypothetical protein
VDRRIANYASGLMEATLRCSAEDERMREHLEETFTRLFRLYGTGEFDVCATANVILQGWDSKKFSVFFGQDFSYSQADKDYSMNAEPTVVQYLSDIERVPTDFTTSDFEDVFYANHPNSSVSVFGLINIVFIARKYLSNFQKESTAPAGKLQLLF